LEALSAFLPHLFPLCAFSSNDSFLLVLTRYPGSTQGHCSVIVFVLQFLCTKPCFTPLSELWRPPSARPFVHWVFIGWIFFFVAAWTNALGRVRIVIVFPPFYCSVIACLLLLFLLFTSKERPIIRNLLIGAVLVLAPPYWHFVLHTDCLCAQIFSVLAKTGSLRFSLPVFFFLSSPYYKRSITLPMFLSIL